MRSKSVFVWAVVVSANVSLEGQTGTQASESTRTPDLRLEHFHKSCSDRPRVFSMIEFLEPSFQGRVLPEESVFPTLQEKQIPRFARNDSARKAMSFMEML